MTRKTHSLGFVASGMASYVLTPLMLGVERAATAGGYFAMITLAHPGDGHAERIVRQLAERRVEGIVGAALAHQGDRAYADALRAMPSAVTVFGIAGGGIPSVEIDERYTGQIATRHLLRFGHRTIAQIVGAPRTSPETGRYRGYRDALAEGGIVPDPDLTDHGVWTAEGGYRAAGRLLDRSPTLTAIFAHNDHMAIGAIRAVRERGLRVPEDVSIVGCDDIDLAGFVAPALTTVQIPFEDLGAAAVRLMLARAEQGYGHPTDVSPANHPERPAAPHDLLRGELVVRHTTGPAPQQA